MPFLVQSSRIHKTERDPSQCPRGQQGCSVLHPCCCLAELLLDAECSHIAHDHKFGFAGGMAAVVYIDVMQVSLRYVSMSRLRQGWQDTSVTRQQRV